MEKELTIPIPGTELKIYAKQYGDLDRPVAIFVHGLTGYMDEVILYNGARYFHERGISSLRFNLYDWRDDARKLTDCTLQTHADDLGVVVEYLRQEGVETLFALGHSYGGPTILLSDQEHLKAIVLWDSTDHGDWFAEDTHVPSESAYRVDWGYSVLMGEEMHNEALKLDWEKAYRGAKVPTKLITAEKGDLVDREQTVYGWLPEPKELATISNATHGFTEDGAAKQLFDESLSWIKKFA